MDRNQLAKALYKDFKELLQPEFTIDWREKQFLLGLYLEVMSFDNTNKLIARQSSKTNRRLKKLAEENKELREIIQKYHEEEMERQDREMMDYLIKEEEKFNDYSFMED